MLRVGFAERGNMDRVLIFTRTKHGADRVVKLLAGNGIAANAIHGNKSQPQRERALAEFKARQGQDPGRDRHRRARHRRFGRQPRDQFRAAQRRRAICPPHRPHRARRRGGRRHRLLRRGRAGLSASDIEKLTRQKIEVVPLPANFIAEADRIKATRTAPPPPIARGAARRGARPSAASAAARPARPRPLCLGGQADGRQPPARVAAEPCLRGRALP